MARTLEDLTISDAAQVAYAAVREFRELIEGVPYRQWTGLAEEQNASLLEVTRALTEGEGLDPAGDTDVDAVEASLFRAAVYILAGFLTVGNPTEEDPTSQDDAEEEDH